jgi:hypothetical protein
MSGHRPWREISEKLRADPERRARIERREWAIEEGLSIEQYREGGEVSQMKPGSRRKSSFLLKDNEVSEKWVERRGWFLC